nr:immunoglobulin heavy chain junction region [Mus musculus]
CARTGFDYW